MANLSISDALIAELEPYTASPITINKAMVDAELSPEDEYTQEQKKGVAKAAISVLRKLIVLSSDSLGKSSQGYNVDKLEKRIKALAAENDLDVSDLIEMPTVTDGSNMW